MITNERNIGLPQKDHHRQSPVRVIKVIRVIRVKGY
jgi:hypothetical protein